ncbi:MAG TPA: SDR family oxidoreductase [Candidatus Dormibacteraeota bacterium]
MDLRGAVAIVTGGGTGIGREVSLQLARAGAAAIVVNYSRSAADAERTASEIQGLGVESSADRANVAVESECQALVQRTLDRFGRLSVLVNNAGTTRHIEHSDLEALTDEVWDEILDVNLKGTFYMTRAAAAALKESRGAVVNVASIAGWRATGSSIPYGVSKAGIMQLTRNLALALAPDVRVNSVAPGLVRTRWFRQPLGEEKAEERERELADKSPLKQIAGPEEVAQAVVGLLGMDLVTGENLIVDAGLHLLY